VASFPLSPGWPLHCQPWQAHEHRHATSGGLLVTAWRPTPTAEMSGLSNIVKLILPANEIQP